MNLNLNLKTADVSFPLLSEGSYPCEIANAEAKQGKNNPDYKYLEVVFQTLEEAQATNGSTIAPGYRIYGRYPLQDFEDAEPGSFQRKLVWLITAALNCEQSEIPDAAASDIDVFADTIIDHNVLVKVIVKGLLEDGTADPENEFGPSNDVRKVSALNS